MDNSKSTDAAQRENVHAEAISALRTYAITKRREADKLDAEARKTAQAAANMIAHADAARKEADAYTAAASDLETVTHRFVVDASSIAFSDPSGRR